MAARAVITLLTDFGLDDAYVGTMKGVIAGIDPDALVIDICHRVPPQDLRRGGFIWASALPFFPPGSVHVAVVDPGVGSGRKILTFQGRGSIFLAPDNGIIAWALARRQVRRAWEVRPEALSLGPASATFHGRDIFAPVAARLASGLAPSAVGPPAGGYRRDEPPRPRRRRVRFGRAAGIEERGEILHVDAFGNAITNLRPLPGRSLRELRAGSFRASRLSGCYGEAAAGEALALVGSTGHIEVAVRDGDAARSLGLETGDRVVATWA